jgi:predicted lactoylglutathione lyase
MLLFLWSNTFHFSGRLPAKKNRVQSSMQGICFQQYALFFVFLNVNESYHKKVETQISVGRHARQVLIIYVDNIEHLTLKGI